MRLAAVPLALVLATSCVGVGALGMPRAHPVSALSDRAVTVASFDFPESSLLAELYAQAVEGAGVHVMREFGLGPRELILPALEKGVVELLPEYAGSALAFVTLQESSGAAGPIQTTGALRVALAPSGVDVLQPSPAEDQNAVAVTLSTARRFGLSDVSELRDVAAQLTFGGPPECTERSYCLLGLEQTYGLHFKRFVSLDAGGPLTIEALRSGAVDAALMFSSDGAIASNRFVLLRDDRHLQPADNVVPVVRTEVIQHWPQLGPLLDRVSADLTTGALRAMNAAVEIEGRSPATVAAAWLRSHDLEGEA